MRSSSLWLALALLAAPILQAYAADARGTVIFKGLPVPGALVTASRDGKTVTAVTDAAGAYTFAELSDGTWTVSVEMFGFTTVHEQIEIRSEVRSDSTPRRWELSLLTLSELQKNVYAAPRPPQLAAQPATPGPSTSGDSQRPDSAVLGAESGLLVNGSVSNGATSTFHLPGGFGNNRSGGHGPYNFSLVAQEQNSALDARSYSLAGNEGAKPTYNNFTGAVTFGGPLRIPRLLRDGPHFFAQYTWHRVSTAATTSALVPTAAERTGDLASQTTVTGQPLVIYNPATGQPYANNKVPVTPQAQALLNLYPLPNVAGNRRFNFQLPLLSSSHVDAGNLRMDKSVDTKNQLRGYFNFSNTRSSGSNLFGFTDTERVLGLNSNIDWLHSFNQRLRLDLAYDFSRLATTDVPYWQNRTDISGSAGIQGNSRAPVDWGPPTLSFSGGSGIAELTDGVSAHNRNQTDKVSASLTWNHSGHNLAFGFDFRRQQFNYLAQANPRGTLTFTGTATSNSNVPGSGSDLAGFLIGVPDASAISFGNADKYLRQSVYNAYVNDDWRLSPELSINAGIRWEFGAPMTELKDRLVNLDLSNDFTAAAPVLASAPAGTVTGQRYPDSLLRPYRLGLEPRIGFAWHPNTGTSMVVRGGYGINYDTSVYPSLYLQLAQQVPFSKTLSLQNSTACPLTLASAFNPCATTTQNTFAVDPNLKIGSIQTWRLEVQRDLPWSLQWSASYLGNKGTHGMQKSYPNSYAPGAGNPCPECPVGFAYISSGGNSTREAGQLQLRRRLHSGFAASVSYTFAKSIDNDAVLGGKDGGSATLPAAQNWRDLAAERGLSSNDQRHLLTASAQYTTGMGIGGGSLIDGWRGAFYKEWTALLTISAGSGLPVTPYTAALLGGTGAHGSVRPDLTGASVYAAPAGLALNPAAFVAPASGKFGNARRNSITGPSQLSMDFAMSRTFRLRDHWNLDLQIKANNVLNHVAFGSYVANIQSTQFGLPASPSNMRTLQMTARLRY
ncbi:carboxypeptidase regulatory-like domain-containing protein [Terriglobus albidus]|uniref:carboxypeptidase regulatory-like domain-containing protein n=1 Tax=Terriglobus albidus TaxID=1592106 RepID=UPI0021E0C6DC|nr:carboxypeptidase regulatory-like domain-containing protein [Terriglobus albidus]